MNADDALDEVLRLARDPALSDYALRDAVRDLLQRITPDEREAVSERARVLLAQRLRLH